MTIITKFEAKSLVQIYASVTMNPEIQINAK